jgi:heterodisulfide reductase subunit D
LVELEYNRENCTCCGGGGNLEMIDPKLTAAVAKNKIEEIHRTRAELVVTSCQQCVRTISGTARREKIDLKVMDIIELVLRAM